MIFDDSKVYYALNAKSLQCGDFAILAKSIGCLKEKFKRYYEDGNIEMCSRIGRINDNEWMIEIFEDDSNDGLTYAFAYLIKKKPKQRYAKYKKWEEMANPYIDSTNYTLTRPTFKIRSKFNKNIFQIIGYYKTGVIIYDAWLKKVKKVHYKKLLLEFEFLNGSICGKLIDE